MKLEPKNLRGVNLFLFYLQNQHKMKVMRMRTQTDTETAKAMATVLNFCTGVGPVWRKEKLLLQVNNMYLSNLLWCWWQKICQQSLTWRLCLCWFKCWFQILIAEVSIITTWHRIGFFQLAIRASLAMKYRHNTTGFFWKTSIDLYDFWCVFIHFYLTKTISFCFTCKVDMIFRTVCLWTNAF